MALRNKKCIIVYIFVRRWFDLTGSASLTGSLGSRSPGSSVMVTRGQYTKAETIFFWMYRRSQGHQQNGWRCSASGRPCFFAVGSNRGGIDPGRRSAFLPLPPLFPNGRPASRHGDFSSWNPKDREKTSGSCHGRRDYFPKTSGSHSLDSQNGPVKGAVELSSRPAPGR